MRIRLYILFIISIALFSCVAKKVEKNIGDNNELTSNPDLAKSALNFANHVLKENLRVHFHERARSSYLDVQMIFETDNFVTDNFISYTSYSNQLNQDNSEQNNYDGFILFVATYNDSKSAEFAFQELKSNSDIRLSELEGFSGLLVEQVQVLERVRKTGGIITQKGKYVFYLLKTCGKPPVEANWNAYENLFLGSITEKNEEIQVLNAYCGMDGLRVQDIIASR